MPSTTFARSTDAVSAPLACACGRRLALEPILQFLCDGNESAAVLCDARFRIVLANGSACDLARESAPLSVHAGVLRLSGFRSAESIQRSISDRCGRYLHRIAGDFGICTLTALHVSAGYGLPALIALRVTRSNSELGLEGRCGLTTAERDVAAYLFEGLSLAGIAARRGVSINTVKTQARMLRSKLHVRTRAALIRRLCELSAPRAAALRRRRTPCDPGERGRTHRPSTSSSRDR
jgi:DNA-binding NarL/FixJ family response regulator